MKTYFDLYDDTLLANLVLDYLQKQSAAINRLSPPLRAARRSDLSPRSLHHRTLSGSPGADIPSSVMCAWTQVQATPGLDAG